MDGSRRLKKPISSFLYVVHVTSLWCINAPQALYFLSTSFSSFYLPIAQYAPFSFFCSIVQGQLYRASSLAASQMDLAVFLHADILVVLAILTGLLQTAKLLRCLLLLIRECRAARRDASRSRGLAIAESFTNVLRAVLAMQGTGFLLPKFEEFLLGVNLFGNCLVGVFAYQGNTIVLELLLLVLAVYPTMMKDMLMKFLLAGGTAGNAQGDDAGDQGNELQEIIVHDTSDSAN